LNVGNSVVMLQLMIGFNRGVMVLWNLESSSVELTYVAATVSFMPVILMSSYPLYAPC